MDSADIYYEESGNLVEFQEFLNNGFVFKTGYRFSGWYVNNLFNLQDKLFDINNQQLKWNIVKNYSIQAEDVVFSPVTEINKITLYAGFNPNRYEVKFITQNADEKIEGNTSLYFEYGTNNLYDAMMDGNLVPIASITKAIKTGYRITCWNILKFGQDEIHDKKELILFEYSDFYSADNYSVSLNLDIQVNNSNIFSQNHWVSTSDLVVYPEFEAIAIELKLNTRSENWHTGLSNQVSYYAKYNDKNIYISDNNKLIKLKPEEEIVKVNNINSQYINYASFFGWGFKTDQQNIYNNIVLIRYSSEDNCFEKNIELNGNQYTDENGNFIYLKKSTITLAAIAKRITNIIEFKTNSESSLLDSNNEPIAESTIKLSTYYNASKDDFISLDGKTVTFPKATKQGHTFIGWVLENRDLQIVEFIEGQLDFVANISIEEDSNIQNITNKNRCWIGKQDISLVPLFEVNVYSINFSAVNNIKNSSIPKLSGLKSSTSTDEYNGQSVLLSFEYNSH